MKPTITLLLASTLLAAQGIRAMDEFDATEHVVIEKAAPKKSTPAPGTSPTAARSIRLNRGESLPVYSFRRAMGVRTRAFYVPDSGGGVVQLFLERKGMTDTWFAKGLARGTVRGAVVDRAWLDESGFRPRNIADEARIQFELRNSPITLEVR